MKFPVCVACGSTEDLQHHHLVPRKAGGSDDEFNLVTLCTACHHKMHARQMNGDYSHSQLVLAGLERAKARGAQLGRRPTVSRDAEKVAAIRVARAAGKSFREIAWEFEVGHSTVRRLTASN